jgi:hypothetical protein
MLARTRIHGGLGLLAALALAACSGSATPQLIGAYPREAVGIATYVPPAGGAMVVSDAYLDLRVANVAAAAEQAEAWAYEYGGYVSESASWYEGDRLHVTLTLAVPVATYDTLYTAVLRLGRLEGERVRSTLSAYSDGNPWNHFSSITVHLAPEERAWRLPALPTFGWSPLVTFRAAFGVFAGIATFVIDLLIWLTVVFGPFVLLGLGLRALVRRWRPRP